MLGTLGCADYEIRVVPRGLTGTGKVISHPGWTALTWEWRQRDKSQATVTIGNIGNASSSCRSVFSDIVKWDDELLITRRDDGRIWSGPITGRATQAGSGIITAYLLDVWMSKRDLLQKHDLPDSDLADAYAELWHDAMDRENSAGWQITTTKTGLSIPVAVAITDHAMADQTAQPLYDAGLDYVTVDRTTIAGPPDTTVLTPFLLDHHVAQIPDVSDDGTNQATRYGVIGQAASSAGNALPPYAEETSVGVPELVVIEQNSNVSTQKQATVLAKQRIQTYSTLEPIVSNLILKPTAPFALSDLIPGRLVNARLYQQAIPIDGQYRISRVAATMQSGSSEQVSIELAIPELP